MNNRIRDAFDSIHAEETLKRQTKARLSARVYATTAIRRARGRRFAAAFACLALAFLGLGSAHLYFTPVSAISVDINPSIELGVNRFDRVVSVKGYNDDGAVLAAAVAMKHQSYTDALDALFSSAEMTPYLKDDAVVSIAVIGATDEASEKMRARIACCGFAETQNVECICGDREDAHAAHDAGLSFGKYRAFLELQALDPSVTAADIQGLSMRQIRERIESLGSASNDSHRSGGHGSHGSGEQGCPNG